MGKGERPEHQAPPEIFYNDTEAAKYTSNSRIMQIQASLTQRALELLALPEDGQPRMLLDLGCGSGLSGEELSDKGHMWVGTDISPSMLDIAIDREVEGDIALHDLGHGLPFRPGTFDGAISISAVQWLCNADKKCNEPRRRLRCFFQSLYACLTRGARAVLQVYPDSPAQAEMMVSAAMKVGFSGGLVVDFPHSTRAKKFFLVLMVGSSSSLPQPKGMDGGEPDEEGQIQVSGRQRQQRGKRSKQQGRAGGKAPTGSKEWIVHKKDTMRKRGYADIPQDTKYTGRKRKKTV